MNELNDKEYFEKLIENTAKLIGSLSLEIEEIIEDLMRKRVSREVQEIKLRALLKVKETLQ